MNNIDDDPADDDPEYRNPEEEQNPKLRAIQSVQGNNRGKKEPKELRMVLHHKMILLEFF